jgi:hypothetical protein
VASRVTSGAVATERSRASSTWDIALTFWPLEDRPELMRNRETVEAMELSNIFTLMEKCEALAKKEGKGEASFGRDRKLPRKKYPEEEDDCAQALHAVR